MPRDVVKSDRLQLLLVAILENPSNLSELAQTPKTTKVKWRPQRESNPPYRLERPVS